MTDDIILQVTSLGKCFKIYQNPWHRAYEWASFSKRRYHEPFHALQEISFEVKRGEFFGIIGQNGAGKSTLLKILSGILQPTSGSYHLNGKMLSMLELGVDFNPYLSGRQNLIRSAEVWGFPEGYAQQRLPQIEDFAELGEFFDRPVGLYSMGMTLRLAFSLYVFLECDVLILDEVLAVGDLFFRQKCYARLEELIAENTTIILVSHDMTDIRQYCNHVALLDKGREIYQGNAQDAIRQYFRIRHGWGMAYAKPPTRKHVPEATDISDQDILWPDNDVFAVLPISEEELAHLTAFAVCNNRGAACLYFTQGERAYFYVELALREDIGVPISLLTLTNKFKILVHGKLSTQYTINVPQQVNKDERLRICQSIDLSLAPGEYVFGYSLFTMHPDDYALRDEYSPEERCSKIKRLYYRDQVGYLIVEPLDVERQRFSHVGICDLYGDCQMQVVKNMDDSERGDL